MIGVRSGLECALGAVRLMVCEIGTGRMGTGRSSSLNFDPPLLLPGSPVLRNRVLNKQSKPTPVNMQLPTVPIVVDG